jgi:hypothetical protein
VKATSVQCEAGPSHSKVEQPTTTPAERQEQKERDRKANQKRRKRAEARMLAEALLAEALLAEALARVDTPAGVSHATLDALDAAIKSVILARSAPCSSTDGCAGSVIM